MQKKERIIWVSLLVFVVILAIWFYNYGIDRSNSVMQWIKWYYEEQQKRLLLVDCLEQYPYTQVKDIPCINNN